MNAKLKSAKKIQEEVAGVGGDSVFTLDAAPVGDVGTKIDGVETVYPYTVVGLTFTFTSVTHPEGTVIIFDYNT